MSFKPFKDFVKERAVSDGIHTIVYKAHTLAEFDEVRRALVNNVSLAAKGRARQPTSFVLGPCVAFVNVFVLEVQLDNRALSFTIRFQEAPRTPIR